MAKKHRKYTKEFKQEAVRLALKNPNTSEAAKSLGIPMATLHGWINVLKGQKQTTTSCTTTSNAINNTVLLEENRRLHKEIVILKEEKEILKKAATYFAQNQK
jgi:transposase